MIFVSLQSYKQSKIHLCDFKLFHALIVSLFSFFFKGGGGGGGYSSIVIAMECDAK